MLLNVLVRTDGHAKRVKVVKSAGAGFDENAIRAVKKWRFKPAVGQDGRPVSVVTTIEMRFRPPRFRWRTQMDDQRKYAILFAAKILSRAH